MLALDLDDSLLRSDFSVSAYTRSIIKRVEEAGILVVLVSGRIPAAMDTISRLLGMHKRPGYLICNNGAIIQETQSSEIVYEVTIPSALAVLAFDLADAEGFPVQIYDNNIMYISRANEYSDYDQKITGFRQVVVENFREMVSAGCCRLLIPGDPMILSPLEKLLRVYVDSLTFYANGPYSLEILPPNTNKGSALARVAELLAIDRESVLAIGNSMVDSEMLAWAGIGVAMANGDDQIKHIAAAVTEKGNDEDGIADFLERYILGQEKLPV